MELVRIEIVLSVLVAMSALASVLLTVISLKVQRDYQLKIAKPLPRTISLVRIDKARIGIIDKEPGTMLIKSIKYFFNDEEFEKFHQLWQKHFAFNHPDGVHKGYRLIRQPLPAILMPGSSVSIILLEAKQMDDLDAYFERRLMLLEGLSQLRIEYTYTDIYDSKFPSASIDNRGFFKRKLQELKEGATYIDNSFSETNDME